MQEIIGLTRQQIAQLLASDIPDGSIVNLGIGMPTLVGDYLPSDRDILLHSENGILGMGPAASGEDVDTDLINASRQPVTLRDGASITEHTVSFAMMRGGHLDYAVLGAFQVSERGDLANWKTDAADAIPAVGGAMDLAVGARQVLVTMEHRGRDGTPKLLRVCTYPLTGKGVVTRIYTDLAVIDVTPPGFSVHAMLAGVDAAFLRSVTGAPLHFPAEIRRIALDAGGRPRYV
ncbi:3-oxoacid CoA-transferase subunit B [Achromobacter denitrificans]|jgi:3-oxoadipate CoA-transferase beta subunit|uniref:3-oxoacid CoA-transferase subunit B n=1 Tax=Achromobacter denitrificans TaxID=32002 RepID=A0A3R9GPN7_ACHDE|nr:MULTISPECIES: 3-oxoacid CoA-transferase subunit B [Achromobacter]ASC64336.1 3-oxoadipate CoA-transferase [Achromobacter denitrificans]MBV2162615.1 3-oxoacid CoA-transferase subunit B [Achromobacter denitrificans]MDF3856867.1 3-oxoacid CoA-transferase subunit B [Achromobacter denitrificans]MDF3944737.1 3-oxoacid CoA-transferase subunit B [Achromobacter denitrificans]MDX3880989.1 3-oxoacid CoA-transferase subunit B [Achromobacter sp.]